MRSLSTVALSLVALAASFGLSNCAIPRSPSESGRETPEFSEAHDRLAWWRDARLGMFVHWGLYAIPAGEWNGGTDHGEWIRTTGEIPLERYEGFQAQWNPTAFDADKWVRAAKDAGVKYIVITTKHHDGFCLFDSAATTWDVMGTPFKRDIMKEMSAACAREGLRMCWYHSIMDWHHPDYLPRRDWEKARSTDGADFDRYVAYLHQQVTELLTKYGPIGLMWFDGEWESAWNHTYGKSLYELCRKLQPDVIVNNRVDVGRSGMAGMTGAGEFCGDYGTPEQEVPAKGFPGVDWESCMTMNDHWGFNAHDKNFKSTRELLRTLSDIASKGGNFLLNVGPTALGEIPQASLDRLAGMGRWMKVNGDAIYGTSASPIEAPKWGRVTQKRSGDDTRLYLHVFEWPMDGELSVSGLGNAVLGARLLANPAQKLSAKSVDGSIAITLPNTAPDSDISVVELVLRGAPIVYSPPRIDAASDVFVDALDVEIHTDQLDSFVAPKGLESSFAAHDADVRFTTDGSEPTARSKVVSAPIHLTQTTIVKARLFSEGRPVTPTSSRRFEHVAPHPATVVESTEPGLVCSAYAGSWTRLPKFADIAVVTRSIASNVELAREQKQAHFGLSFDGFVEVQTSALYMFELTSDDGSKLTIDGVVVVDNDGPHAAITKTGSIALAAGKHALHVEWFNATGDAALELKLQAGSSSAFEKPRFEKIPVRAFSHAAVGAAR